MWKPNPVTERYPLISKLVLLTEEINNFFEFVHEFKSEQNIWELKVRMPATERIWDAFISSQEVVEILVQGPHEDYVVLREMYYGALVKANGIIEEHIISNDPKVQDSVKCKCANVIEKKQDREQDSEEKDIDAQVITFFLVAAKIGSGFVILSRPTFTRTVPWAKSKNLIYCVSN